MFFSFSVIGASGLALFITRLNGVSILVFVFATLSGSDAWCCNSIESKTRHKLLRQNSHLFRISELLYSVGIK